MENKIYLLICDDENHLTKIRSEKFTRDGYEVKIAGNGEECLKLVKKRLPDILLLDIKLPGISGIEVLRKLRKSKRTRKIPVIVNSVYSSELDIAAAKEYDIVEYLPKSKTRLNAIAAVVDKVRDSLKKEP